MLQRLFIIASLALLLMLGVQSCAPTLDAYRSMQIEKIDGRPYLLLERFSSSTSDGELFSIYAPKSDDLTEWESVVDDRLGNAFGLFPYKSHANENGPAQLGVLHGRRVSYLDLSVKPPTVKFDNLPFQFTAETSAVLDGVVYIFGVEPYELKEGESVKLPLKAARFVDGKWQEVAAAGPKLTINYPGFWLKAITIGNEVRVLWRTADTNQTLHPLVEGPRFTTSGSVKMSNFDGKTYVGEPLIIDGLPSGNASAWADGNDLRLLVQTQGKLEDALYSGGAMEFWKIAADGKTEKQQTIDKSRAKSGLLAFIVAEYLQWEGNEYILRSNWQMFELWRKDDAGAWAMVTRTPRGLPVYDLETVLLGSLAVGLTLIAFGAGLAYRRRKHHFAKMKRVLATELYATLGLRMGAYAIDLTLIMLMTVLLGYALKWDYKSPLQMVPLELTTLPHWPFFFIYMGYFVGAETLFGATLGKALMGLMVVGDDGEKINLWSALVRNLIGLYERGPVVAIVAMWMMMLGPRRQRIGDLLSRSYVVQRAALEILKRQRLEDARQQKAITGLPAITPPGQPRDSNQGKEQ